MNKNRQIIYELQSIFKHNDASKVLGFLFDDKFLFEPGPTVDVLLPDAERCELFPGSKLFVLIDDSIGSKELCELAQACYDDLPTPKPRKGKGKKIDKESVEKRFPFAKRFQDI